jgi:putative hydrolase of the HAD superfamily
LELLEVEAGSAAVVEDSPNGLKAALAAGIRTVVVPNPLVESLNFSGAFARYKSLDVLPAGELLDLVFGQLN